ncbi:MAG TPA: endonuclease III [Candidatus Dormibacteraeota bacterium]|nr:endonuclease III [Candidatus Dormibacteraeota bacterium]
MARAPAARPRLSHPRGARTRALQTVELLAAEYPDAETELAHRDPFELLVATILSAQTTDERVNLVTPALFARYPDAPSLARAPLDDVEDIIRTTGFFRSKSRAIVEMSQDLVERHGGAVPARMEDLVQLRGVGRKTANVVLGVAFGVPGLAVDTHVTRLTNLLHLTRSADPERIETEVTALVPPAEWTDLGLRLILHGRRVCIARRPLCERCVLAAFCPSAGLAAAERVRAGAARPARTSRPARRST